MRQLSVHHVTVYRYRRPVCFGAHRLMFRPRDSHDLRLIGAELVIDPPARVRWLHDVFSNSIAIARFEDQAEELRFESRIRLEHFGFERPDVQIEAYAERYPFSYSSEDIADLARTNERHYPDPEGRIDAWVKDTLAALGAQPETARLLDCLNQAVHDRFAYQSRFSVGVQSPVETLDQGSGTCRDLALFMMEAARALGLAARFVSGYLYDPALDGGTPSSNGGGLLGGGATHAWVQIFLPGAGWVEYDPTNGLIGGPNLIRVAVTRDPMQALPLQGTYIGDSADLLAMTVDVRVTAETHG